MTATTMPHKRRMRAARPSELTLLGTWRDSRSGDTWLTAGLTSPDGRASDWSLDAQAALGPRSWIHGTTAYLLDDGTTGCAAGAFLTSTGYGWLDLKGATVTVARRPPGASTYDSTAVLEDAPDCARCGQALAAGTIDGEPCCEACAAAEAFTRTVSPPKTSTAPTVIPAPIAALLAGGRTQRRQGRRALADHLRQCGLDPHGTTWTTALAAATI